MNNNKNDNKKLWEGPNVTLSFKNDFFINLGYKSMFENFMMLYIWN